MPIHRASYIGVAKVIISSTMKVAIWIAEVEVGQPGTT